MHSSPQKFKKRVKDLPASSLPQEKLIAKGRQNITDEELLAILLGTGSQKENVLLMAASLLKRLPLKKFSEVTIAELSKTSGIGKAKAARILAAVEFGERLFSPVTLIKSVIRTTEDALVQLKDIANKKQEHLVVLYLNARYELLQKEILALGSLNTTIIEPKEVFTPAVMSPCHAIILGHNHPSGDPTPSDADVQFTKRIHEAGEIMGVTLLDHVVIAQHAYFSFRDGKSNGNKLEYDV